MLEFNDKQDIIDMVEIPLGLTGYKIDVSSRDTGKLL